MSRAWIVGVGLLIAGFPLVGEAQGLSWCEKGSICWADGSGGRATTELRVHAEGGELSITVGPGFDRVRLAEPLRASSLLPSDWLCVQARHRYPDGAVSAWYLSENEGICHQTKAVMPATPPTPAPPPAPVPPEPSMEIFTGVTNSNGLLSFSYRLTDCPRGVQQTTSAEKNGQKTITLKCRR